MPAAEALFAASGPATPSIAPLPELFGMLGQLLLGDVGEKGGNLRAAGWYRAEREAERSTAQPGLPGALPVLFAQEWPAHRDDVCGPAAQMCRNPEGFAEGEDADGHDDDVDPVTELGHAEAQS